MKRIFSAWASHGGQLPHTLVVGEGPPRFADGTPDSDCHICVWRIEVGSFEEALAIFDLRRGFRISQPVGDVGDCPMCGVIYYPSGSGQCWNCDYEN